jgi:hypothetical protein
MSPSSLLPAYLTDETPPWFSPPALPVSSASDPHHGGAHPPCRASDCQTRNPPRVHLISLLLLPRFGSPAPHELHHDSMRHQVHRFSARPVSFLTRLCMLLAIQGEMEQRHARCPGPRRCTGCSRVVRRCTGGGKNFSQGTTSHPCQASWTVCGHAVLLSRSLDLVSYATATLPWELSSSMSLAALVSTIVIAVVNM